MRVLHLTTHINIGGITAYISRIAEPLSRIGTESFVLSGGGACRQDLEKLGVKTFELSIKTKNVLNPKIYFAIPQVEKIIREKGIDLIHAHTRITQVMAAVLSKRTGIPVVTTCHGYFKPRLGRRLFPAWGDLTIAISQGVSEHLVRDFKLDDDRIFTVNNAVNLEELDKAYISHDPEESKKFYGFTPAQPVIGVIARLVADKGHEYLLRALPIIAEDFPDAGILIAGDGRERKNLEKLAKELGIQKRTVFTGNVRDISKVLSATDISVLPATWREGFGLSVIEAMACRKPVIVTNIPALDTLVQNKVNGILVEPKQANQLAEAVVFLLKNPAESARLGNASRKMVEDNFTISRMAGEINEVYKKAVLLHPEYRQRS